MQTFARELRLQCARKGSIAQLCKATGINRQQFNKYLAGQMLPSTRTLRKICRYLEVTEEQLLTGRHSTDQDAARSIRSAIDFDGRLPPALHLLRQGHANGLAAAGVRLPNGLYECYSPAYMQPGLLVRWVLHLGETQHGQVYSYRTHIRGAGCGGCPESHVRYRGAVIYGAGDACLIGTARPPNMPAIMSVNTVPVAGDAYFSALALKQRSDGPVALSVAMHFRGASYPPRQALAAMGLVSLSDPFLDTVVSGMMHARPASGSNWLRPVRGSDLPTGQLSGGSDFPLALAAGRLSV